MNTELLNNPDVQVMLGEYLEYWKNQANGVSDEDTLTTFVAIHRTESKKVLFITEDGIEVADGEQIVYYCNCNHELNEFGRCKAHEAEAIVRKFYKYFSTAEARDNYIIADVKRR